MANDKDFKIKNGLQLGGAFIEKVGTIAGNATLDLSTGNVFSLTPSANVTFVFSNVGATEHSFVISITPSATVTLTYPASVYWPSGTVPVAPAVGETDILEFSTTDGGTVWYGTRAGDAMA